MSLLLLIDSAGETGSVAITEDNRIIAFRSCNDQKEQAGFLQPAIKEMLDETGIPVSDLSAVAVTIGPGSYTGLRVGLASAKGICYAMNIPLITITSTFMMAVAGKNEFNNSHPDYSSFYLCPMIDARRMEVFLAVYDDALQEIQKPVALILNSQEMISFTDDKPVFCFGNGANKWKNFNLQKNIFFGDVEWDVRLLADEAAKRFKEQAFDSLEASKPLYVKDFYTGAIVK